jgi:flavodoxin I
MAKVGIFFGTDTGNTRKVAKNIAKQLGDVAGKPDNIKNVSVDDLLAYDVLILGSPLMEMVNCPV